MAGALPIGVTARTEATSRPLTYALNTERALPSKYRNRPKEVDGIKFASIKEAKRYRELLLLKRGGVISDLELQPKFPITIGGIPIQFVTGKGQPGRQMIYVADFRYRDNETGRIIIEDVKGTRTDVFKIKRALMAAMGHKILET
jgi:hypothetical protein